MELCYYFSLNEAEYLFVEILIARVMLTTSPVNTRFHSKRSSKTQELPQIYFALHSLINVEHHFGDI